MTEIISSLILLFPANYQASRATFRTHCTEASAVCETFVLPNEKDAGGLSVDAATFEPKSPPTKALVLMSGTHGVETPAGAAIQELWIKNYKAAFLEKNIRVILVHAINPWGFENRRRGTQKNIDLNRNFPSDGDIRFAGLSAPGPTATNQGYDKLSDILGGEQIQNAGLWQRLKFARKMLWPVVSRQMTVAEVNQAVAGGQREYPRGLFYGGGAPEPQIDWLGDYLDKNLEGISEAVIMDLHTGLGERGVLHLMSSDQPDLNGQELRRRVFPVSEPGGGECLKDIPCKSIYTSTSGSTEGFYSVSGDFLDFAEDLGNENLRIAAFTMEFGTRGTGVFAQLESLFTMTAENACYQSSKGDRLAWSQEDREVVSQKFEDLFNPADPSWRAELLEKSGKIFERLLQAF